MDSVKSNKNLNQWLRSTGYLFPESEEELMIFDLIYSKHEYKISEDQINPSNILQNLDQVLETKISFNKPDIRINPDIKMAARNLKRDLPDDIRQKLGGKHKNQDSSND